ncbi:histidine phosphatase family protein [Paenibacillus hodogayensis]|uniref:Histidine phosphatase family protein n=1 Tax=Paenibacillus hodogayensis TaxID=279208 RepID=A0ABV5W638_9BACL
MTVIGLIRHGVTDWNVQLRAQGHTDIPLNEAGRQQAGLLAGRIGAEAWDAVYSSDLGRAFETARTATAALGLEVLVDERLREVFLGEIEGTTEEERVNRWGADWRQRELGEEPRDEAADRGLQAIRDIADKHPNQRVLIVSHGGLIGCTLKKMVPEAEFAGFLGNTSVTLVRRNENGGWACDLYNCTTHLESKQEREEA